MTVAIHPAETEPPVAEAFQPLDIAVDRCKGCGLCVAICPKHVLALEPSFVNEHGYHPVQLTDAAACTELRAVRTDLPGHGLHRLRATEGKLTCLP